MPGRSQLACTVRFDAERTFCQIRRGQAVAAARRPGAEEVLAVIDAAPSERDRLLFSRTRAAGGARRSMRRQQGWEVVRAASERANVRVLALRASRYGATGGPAPVHPHLFRHARVRQLMRTTKSLPIAQKRAGWSPLQMAYVSVTEDEVRLAMQVVAV